uniref:Uncharacterized protein n=1 Tax=Sphaerodactylus townsendi TaxID=933632 RepID=A0ACB8FSN6_9SAUR
MCRRWGLGSRTLTKVPLSAEDSCSLWAAGYLAILMPSASHLLESKRGSGLCGFSEHGQHSRHCREAVCVLFNLFIKMCHSLKQGFPTLALQMFMDYSSHQPLLA